jgi:chromosome segregation ATPase
VLLSPAERADLAAELQAEYDGSDDSDLEEKVESYRQADPTVVDNELHSILGTEVADLSAELEAYYARWFIDRSQVAALADASQTTFDALEEQVAALDAQLNTLRAEIEDENARLDAEAAALDTFRADLDRLAAEERIDEYNAAVPDFNTRVDAYNVAAGNLQVQIDNYNALVEQRNQLAAEWEQLTEPINTSLGDVSAQPAA